MNCQKCGAAPSDAERAVIDREVAKGAAIPPSGWLCTACRPPGFPADGLCYSVVEVGGESPEHEYEDENEDGWEIPEEPS